jgi:hypothetical protein
MAIDYAAMNKKNADDQAAVDKLSTAKQAALDKQAYKGQRDLNSGRRRMQSGKSASVLPQRIAPGGVEGTAASLGMKKGGKVKKFSGTAGSDVRVDANGNKIQDSEAPKDDPSFSQRLIDNAFEPLGLLKSLKMKKGGAVMKMDKEQDKAMIKKAFKQHDMQEHKGGKGTSLKLKMGGMAGYGSGGKVKTCAKGGGIEVRGKTRGKIC